VVYKLSIFSKLFTKLSLTKYKRHEHWDFPEGGVMKFYPDPPSAIMKYSYVL